MREIRPHRRRFLQAAAAASLAGRLGVRPSRAADLGVDSGPFSTTNETIRKARQAALSILKPTEKDLKRGLELHDEVLVFESYGFAPRCAIDAEAFGKAIDLDSETDGFSRFPDSYDLGYNHGPAAYDLRHVLTSNWIFALPFARGSRPTSPSTVFLGGPSQAR